ncbi:hypothetical protein B7Z17_00715 [Candidatus Saccharibacteria bacterium 32-49-10]|nr:MAG: hypothetical protein B7Z17_00715 [Candidatus Saccharibacteria bacterium 32-49-10]
MLMKKSLATFFGLSAAVILACAAWIGWEFYSYHRDMSAFKEEVALASREGATPEQVQQAEGKDETEPADPLKGYVVAADAPRAIYIDKLGVRARVLEMGLNPDRSIQAPINIFDAGWYNGSAKPGEKGAAVIDGHASGPSREGLFAYVETLAPGDRVMVERGDGVRLEYEVVEKKNYNYENVDMTEVMRVKGGDEGLNLITCTGNWVKDRKTFDTRAIIFTRRV